MSSLLREDDLKLIAHTHTYAMMPEEARRRSFEVERVVVSRRDNRSLGGVLVIGLRRHEKNAEFNHRRMPCGEGPSSLP